MTKLSTHAQFAPAPVKGPARHDTRYDSVRFGLGRSAARGLPAICPATGQRLNKRARR